MAAYIPEPEYLHDYFEELVRELARFRVVDLASLEVTIVHGPQGPEAQLANGQVRAPASRRT